MLRSLVYRRTPLLLSAAAACLLSPTLLAGGVRIVDATGTRNYPSIRAAVQAAAPGDTLIVGEGLYGPFEVDRPLSLIAAPGAEVRVLGWMKIHGVTEGRVLVRGLEFVEILESVYSTIDIEDCSASVRVSSCSVPPGRVPYGGGHVGVSVKASANVVLSDCEVNGGRGQDCNYDENYPQGTYGRHGLIVWPGSSVALFDCVLRGGRGVNCYFDGGNGADALVHGGGFLFASGSDFSPVVQEAGVVEVLDQTMAFPVVDPGGTLTELPGTARKFEAPSVIASDDELTATVHGQLGDRLMFLPSTSTAFEYSRALRGVWLRPALHYLPTGFALPRIPAGGIGGLTLPIPEFEPGQAVQLVSGQGLVYQQPHRPLLANALDVLVLDRDATTPDCNGNGIGDYLEVFDGLVADTNHDMVPDACQYLGPDWYVDASAPAGGGGGPARPFRTLREGMEHALAGHEVIVADGIYTGPDNRNLSFHGTDFVVRSAGGPGGCIIDCEDQGRALEAFGPETRAAVFRGFTIRNAGNQGVLLHPEPDYGGAIRVSCPSAISVEDCIIEDNDVATASAIYTFRSDTHIRNCTIRVDGNEGVYIDEGAVQLVGTTVENNSQRAVRIVPTSQGIVLSGCTIRNNAGGALHIDGRGKVWIDNCLIANNSAPDGAGILMLQSAQLYIKNSALTGNSSGTDGAALRSVTGQDGREIMLENTVVWGNVPSAYSVLVGGHGDSTFRVERCRIEGGQAGILYIYAGGPASYPYIQTTGADPQFLDLIDYRPGPTGSCIDSGKNSLAPPDRADLDGDADTTEPVPHDRDGNPRFVDDPAVVDTGVGTPPLIDIGPYERQP